MPSYTLVEINADDTETDMATELARTEVEALMVFSKEIGYKLEPCDFSDRAEFYLKWLNGGAYERKPVRSSKQKEHAQQLLPALVRTDQAAACKWYHESIRLQKSQKSPGNRVSYQ